MSPWVLPAGQGPSPNQIAGRASAFMKGRSLHRSTQLGPRATTHREPFWAGRVEIKCHAGQMEERAGHGQLLYLTAPGHIRGVS